MASMGRSRATSGAKSRATASAVTSENALVAVNETATQSLRGLLAFGVVFFGSLGAWVPLWFMVMGDEWFWLPLINAVVMNVGVALAVRGWIKKDTRQILAGGGVLFLSLTMIHAIDSF